MSALGNGRSTRRGAAKAGANAGRHLLRVEGVTYTIPELAAITGRTQRQIRERASKLIHRRKAYTLDDFRS